jgi:hypothetical protein
MSSTKSASHLGVIVMQGFGTPNSTLMITLQKASPSLKFLDCVLQESTPGGSTGNRSWQTFGLDRAHVDFGLCAILYRVTHASLSMLWFAGDKTYSACACCHPVHFGKEVEFASAAVVPVCILPAQGDPMEDAKAVLEKKPFADKCFFKRFDDQRHGFMAARGDYSQPEVAAAAGKGLELLANFFHKNMT